MKKHSRRQFLSHHVPIIGGAMGLMPASRLSDFSNSGNEKLKIVVAGAHPDDPETMCGGLMAMYSAAGHEVVSAYLTTGEAGIDGKSFAEASHIRMEEAKAACVILKARPVFLGQIDGQCEINDHQYQVVYDFLTKENPDLIITHWPIDTHRDHRICSVLIYDAWIRTGSRCDLYYGEVMTGVQSQNFCPTDYVDITSVAEQKHRACFLHASQSIEKNYPDDHGKMEIFRGMESGCIYAEAFIRQVQKGRTSLDIK